MAPGPTLTNGTSSAKQASGPDLAFSSAARSIINRFAPFSGPASTRDATAQRLTTAHFVDKPHFAPQNKYRLIFLTCAQVAELADALASGASGLTVVEVRVLSWAPNLRVSCVPKKRQDVITVLKSFTTISSSTVHSNVRTSDLNCSLPPPSFVACFQESQRPPFRSPAAEWRQRNSVGDFPQFLCEGLTGGR